MNVLDQHQEFWLQQLKDAPPVPKLPLDKEPPPVSAFLREIYCSTVGQEVWQSVQEQAGRMGVSQQAVVAAALNALLFRYSGQADLVVGAVLNTLSAPIRQEIAAVRTRLEVGDTARDLVLQVGAALREASQHLEVPFHSVQRLLEQDSGLKDCGLFNAAFHLEHSDELPADPSPASDTSCAEHLMNCLLVLRAVEGGRELSLRWEYDAEVMEASTVERLAGHFQNLLAAIAANPNATVGKLAMVGEGEFRQLVVEWNSTDAKVPMNACVHHFIEEQARRAPNAVAAICRNEQLTYAELNARANQVASRLSKLGVGPDIVVGICVERSLDMLVGLLGILKSGGAYLPLDPAYPAERLAFMIEDARIKVLLTQQPLEGLLPASKVPRLRLDADRAMFEIEPLQDVDRGAGPGNLAYVIYTSGSTGKPKGVMIEHRNVVNFFVAMDERIRRDQNSTWLAVTSPSFDISVLELFWTLARGIRVVLFAGDEGLQATSPSLGTPQRRKMDFSLFYFSSDQHDGPGGAYRLLTEGARFADSHGFAAVWTPERHFHAFGGLFPNPSVTSAALAMITNRVQIRSGSVVAPLHSPIRIAEEWSVVDNLSNGRVAISFASGWMPEDFTVSPANYASRKEIMLDHLDTVRRLWRGEPVSMPGPLGKNVSIRIFPRPVQKELPLWLTAAGNPETFQMAGTLGINLLTHLLGQNIEEVAKKMALYRQAWNQAGHPGRGTVTLMLHTFVGQSQESVKETVRKPLIEYLRKSADLIKGYAWAFSAFKPGADPRATVDFTKLPKEEMDALLDYSFNRYYETSGLFGTPESCAAIIEKLRANDVDEVACLIDFGVSAELVLDNLKHLNALRAATSGGVQHHSADYSIPALIERHNVTHLQCTPSMAGMLLLDERTKASFGRLRNLLIGGEAFPAALARQLQAIVRANIVNMYGPTETTVWSSTYPVPADPVRVPVGRPIANTQLYVLDQNLQPLPIGIAGELMIGGAGVARGYLGRPELTAERFIPNPFQDDRSTRLYRTGDLARYLPDGNIELLGRMDHQVKIRGHRVELGEIEALLNEHPAVRESVVIAKETPTGDKRLVAYVVPRNGQTPSRRLLRQYALEKMPEHMVPAEVVLMDSFPQTPNRKIDRKALPAPDAGADEAETGFEAPSTATEEAVAGLWRELLSMPRIGRGDNFFECGGLSLLAMQLVSRVRETFGVHLPLKSLFERPTVAGLAEAIDALSWSAAAKPSAHAVENREVLVL